MATLILRDTHRALEEKMESLDKLKKERKIERDKIINHWTIRIFKLINLRIRINIPPAPVLTPDFAVFRKILNSAKTMISGWNGKLYFVYLPSLEWYLIGNEDINREFVLRSTTELAIPIIDIHREVFDPHSDPLSLFPFRREGHYTAEGYRLVANAISKRLEADGVIPINSEK